MFTPGRYLGASLALVLILAGCAQKQTEPEVPPMTLQEFSAAFTALSGDEANADALLALTQEALDHHAGDDPLYTSTAYSYQSHAYLLKQDLEAAEKAVNIAIQADPSSALAYFTRTDVYYAQNRFDDARTACLKGAEVMPFDEYRSQMRDICEQSYSAYKEAYTAQGE